MRHELRLHRSSVRPVRPVPFVLPGDGITSLVASPLVNSGGDGLYNAGSALFFTRGLGLPVARVGLY